MADTNIKKLTEQTFHDEVLHADRPVLVDFWAPWCAPCRALAPVIDSLASDYKGRVEVGKVNIDENPELATHFGIQTIPTVLVFRDGQVVDQLVGLLPKTKFEAVLARILPLATTKTAA